MKAEIEDTSAIVLGPEGFPLRSSFSFNVPAPDIGAEFDVVAYGTKHGNLWYIKLKITRNSNE